jgi:hypothetical protein
VGDPAVVVSVERGMYLRVRSQTAR